MLFYHSAVVDRALATVACIAILRKTLILVMATVMVRKMVMVSVMISPAWMMTVTKAASHGHEEEPGNL